MLFSISLYYRLIIFIRLNDISKTNKKNVNIKRKSQQLENSLTHTHIHKQSTCLGNG